MELIIFAFQESENLNQIYAVGQISINQFSFPLKSSLDRNTLRS